MAGLSTSYFRAKFKAEMGISPGNYFLKARINASAKLLRETPLPIKEIARRTGYDELPHFYRAFKTVLGTTPKRYRRKHQTLM
jgi:AraC-like DNA-binding protein